MFGRKPSKEGYKSPRMKATMPRCLRCGLRIRGQFHESGDQHQKAVDKK